MPIIINNIVLDPNAPTAFAADAVAPQSAADTNYILVNVSRSLGRKEKEDLAATGAEVQLYVPDNTYKCRFAPSNLDSVRALPFVESVIPYYQGFKVDPALTHLTAGPELVAFEEMLTPGAKPKNEPQEVDVVFHEDVKSDEGAKAVEALVGVKVPDEARGKSKVRLTATPGMIEKMQKLDVVSQIEKVFPAELCNHVARNVLGVPVLVGDQSDLTGEGEVVAVADTGFDNGLTDATVHPAFIGKVRKLYPLGRPNPPNANDPHGHGTHVAGSVLGDGTSATLGVRVQGTAPGAKLVLQSCYASSGSTLGGLPSGLHALFQPPYANDGARIHSNSWGQTNSAGIYNSNAQEVDDFVYNNRNMLVVFAAGNDGVDSTSSGKIDQGSVTAPGTAKNCLTVGACENLRPGNPFSPNAAPVSLTWGPSPRWPVAPISTDHQADNPDGMAPFSGRGPTRNGRIKPDVVAPGSFILSAQSRAMPAGSVSMPTADADYRFSRGTSMATPLVAGCAALVRQWLANEKGTSNPTAALMKALLINGATDIPGQYAVSEAPEIPNNSEGFGRVNVAATVNHGQAAELTIFDEDKELDTGESETREIMVKANAKVKITLVWTDPPGPALQSDLDLIVRDSAGTECHGNLKPNDPSFDRSNNVEQVEWQSPAAGTLSIMVKAARITLRRQSYVLVIRVG